MNVNLTPELENLVHGKVKSGLYNNASEVVRESLRLLKEQDLIRQAKIDYLKKEIHKGLNDLENGRYEDGETFMARLKEEILAK